MGTEIFVPRNFKEDALGIIERANQIIDEYREQGFILTLRQLYYQFVARGVIPNKQTEYKRLGSIINDARLAGLVDWDSIEDRTRNVATISSWDDPAELIEVAANQYRENLWEGQLYRPEIWIEKDALIGVVEPVCEKYRVPRFACRGYTSQSEQYRAGKRFEAQLDAGLRPVVLHLGDHDPSGVDMTRDNADRLEMFAYQRVEVRRLALNMDQIEQYNPPPNPAKETDSRATGYIDRFGDSSWELDALDPRVIDRMISNELDTMIVKRTWDKAKKAETERRDFLQRCSDNWDDVAQFLRGLE